MIRIRDEKIHLGVYDWEEKWPRRGSHPLFSNVSYRVIIGPNNSSPIIYRPYQKGTTVDETICIDRTLSFTKKIHSSLVFVQQINAQLSSRPYRIDISPNQLRDPNTITMSSSNRPKDVDNNKQSFCSDGRQNIQKMRSFDDPFNSDAVVYPSVTLKPVCSLATPTLRIRSLTCSLGGERM